MARHSVASKLKTASTSARPSRNLRTQQTMATLTTVSAPTGMGSISTSNFQSNCLQHPHLHRLRGATLTAAYSNASNVIITPPPPPAPLLLEGDEMYISRDGKSHTLYHLKRTGKNMNVSFHDLLLEESYDIEKAQKRMSLVEQWSLSNSSLEHMPSEDCNGKHGKNRDIFSFDLQEINHGVQNGSGTGSMTWDSSVVMGLYFASNPGALRGHVIELGSGVGLGGILSKVAKTIFCDNNMFSAKENTTVTLTDVNDDVLNMLRLNMNSAAKSPASIMSGNKNWHIKKLDWCEFLGDNPDPIHLKEINYYDTIIASDCAYLHSQITPLSETISKLLGKRKGCKLHMFAPYNRSIIYELIHDLKVSKRMNVDIENIEMCKYRIKKDEFSASKSTAQYLSSLSDNSYGVSKFLHITAWHEHAVERIDEEKTTYQNNRMQSRIVDID